MEKIAIVDSNGEILTYFELLCSAIDVALELEKRKCAKGYSYMVVILLNL